MIDEILETIVPGGAWLTAGVVIGASFASALRPAAVRALALGLDAAERLQEVGAEAYEQAQDLVAEARHEREQRDRTPGAAEPSAPSVVRRRAARSEAQ